MSKRVGIWIRVSTEEQARGDSPEHHEQRALAFAGIKDWNVIETYHLEAVSGKSVQLHPEAKRMVNDIRRGHISGLIFSKLARLARNTRELLEFADIFQAHGADLISLDESIDTSTPAGRFFYTLIAGMAEWERAEIGSRVKASIPIRAKLGKSLGGEAPYGYKWENKELVLDTEEYPVRRLIYDLFLEHKRKRTVAHVLGERGYKTRRGGNFTDTTIDRLLRDPIAKGMRRNNYTESLGNGKHWKLKPHEDWIFTEAPRIVSDEIWEKCNRILDEMSAGIQRTNKKGIHLFSSVLSCICGGKMYMRVRSPRYVCQKCKNKIDPTDLEEIFHSRLESFLFSDLEIQSHLEIEKRSITEKEQLLDARTREFQNVKQKVNNILELYHDGKLSKESFTDHHQPVYKNLKEVEQSMLSIQSEIDSSKMHSLNNNQMLYDARNLHKQWNSFNLVEKKNIIEAITDSIVVASEDIEIKLSYIPVAVQNAAESFMSDDIHDSAAKRPQKPTEDQLHTASILPVSKLVKMCNAMLTVRLAFLGTQMQV